VVVVVVLSSSPDRKPVVERPREVVSGVSVDGLEETKADPGVLQKKGDQPRFEERRRKGKDEPS
jgi:hypothetical protein